MNIQFKSDQKNQHHELQALYILRWPKPQGVHNPLPNRRRPVQVL